MSQQPNWSILIVLVCLGLFIGGLFFFPRYTGLSRGKAFLALLASVIACGLHAGFRIRDLKNVFPHSNNADPVIAAVAGGACLVLLTAFALRLWGRWVGEKATADERQAGLAGVRAWFCVSNVIVGGSVVLVAWFGFDISPLLGAVVIGGLLAAYPVLRMESSLVGSPPPVPDDLSAEREKIVSMLEAGKLTADESAELLQALSQTSPMPPRQVPLTGGQRMMLIGGALVVIGFFLPWFVINAGKEATRMLNQVQSSVGSAFGGSVEMPGGLAFPNPQLKTSSVTISGGDIQRGLGWATLALAVIAALIPYLATSLDAATLRTIRLLCLGIGSVIVLYLLTQNIRFIGIGLIIVAFGYGLEIAGALRKWRPGSV